ncbi:cytochrome c (plasmid) [Peteryoungia desertarenae]|uniref:Cytochrome c n=1 Tax=Peteryoungia desertarenae TaxID=1813451 RepID=A0ABX6QT52_9HYPH|nr:cytochrome c [Peteryoungia desertarenae]QLF71476.1 cytochrome c [Peteryoungia desertarenae]
MNQKQCLSISAALAAWALTSFATEAQELASSQVAKGRYLTQAGDCMACHTDFDNDGIPYAGGRGLETPFGVIYTPNLTPDDETGLGRWSRDDFYRALNEGIGRSGEHLYPAFPYPYFTHMPREDTDAIYDYLRTLTPVRAEKPENDLPFPLSLRGSILGWKTLFFEDEELRRDPEQSEAWNRGRYLVDGPGHCGACHTGKNFLGADLEEEYLRGGTLEHWFAPNIRGGDNGGISDWSERDIVEFLGAGRAPHTAPMQRMGEVVAISTQNLERSDLSAIATYLKSLDDRPEPEREDIETERLEVGEAIYFDSCAACHDADLTGVPYFFAPLVSSNKVSAEDPTTVIRVILEGARAVATDAAPTPLSMPPFAWKLNDDQIADLVSFLRHRSNRPAGSVSASQVSEIRNYLIEHQGGER